MKGIIQLLKCIGSTLLKSLLLLEIGPSGRIGIQQEQYDGVAELVDAKQFDKLEEGEINSVAH